MATDFSSLRGDVQKFNDTFGVQFSFEEYERGVLRSRGLSRLFGTTLSSDPENSVYRTMLLSMFKETVLNKIKGTTDKTPNPIALANAFEDLMEKYRNFCSSGKNLVDAPQLYGGLRGHEAVLSEMRGEITGIPVDKSDYVKGQYVAGRARLRDMKANMDGMRANGVTADKLSQAIVHKRALEKVVSERTGWWRIRHFFRNRAEQRHLQELTDFVQSQQQNSAVYNQAVALADERVVGRAISAINAAIDLSDFSMYVSSVIQPLESANEIENTNQIQQQSSNAEASINENIAQSNEPVNNNENPVIEEKKEEIKPVEQSQPEPEEKKFLINNSKEAGMFLYNSKNAQNIQDQIYKLCGGIDAKESDLRGYIKNTIYPQLSNSISKMWKSVERPSKGKKPEDEVKDGARSVCFGLSNIGMRFVFKMDVKTEMVTFQKITDLMLNQFSPVITDSKYAKYGDNYFMNTLDLSTAEYYFGKGCGGALKQAKEELAQEKAKATEEKAKETTEMRENLHLTSDFGEKKENVPISQFIESQAPTKELEINKQ